MKNIKFLIFLLFVSFLLNACSQVSQHQRHTTASQKSHRAVTQHVKPRASQRSVKPIISQQTSSRSVVKHHSVRDRMVRIATSTIGAPYRWGGNNPQQGFDCSGLMSYVHKNALGMNIPRTAAKQRDTSRTISYAQLRPGDMLFFKTGKESNHVGVYIGNRKFVHAATGSKLVRVASMDSSYWFKRFVKFGTFL